MTNFDVELQQISQLRETKGKEPETLTKIADLESKIVEAQDYTSLAKLYWEKAFVHQHYFMSHVDEADNLRLMEESVLKAHDLVVSHNFSQLTGDDTRFLGRVYDYKKDYPTALSFYHQALDFYQAQNHSRVLEINAFISANLIYQNKVEEGLALAKDTYSKFEDSPLKQADFYTWAVWKTGIYPRLVKALTSQNIDFDRSQIKSILESDRQLLVESNLDFRFRLDEINEALKLLS